MVSTLKETNDKTKIDNTNYMKNISPYPMLLLMSAKHVKHINK